MGKIHYCPQCEEMREVCVELREEVFKVGDDLISVQSKVAVCTVCGTDILDVDLDNETMLRVYAEYRKRHNLLTPEEISALRERVGLSPEALSKLLGWPKDTIKRYENGSLQDKARDGILRKLNDPEYAANLLKTNT